MRSARVLIGEFNNLIHQLNILFKDHYLNCTIKESSNDIFYYQGFFGIENSTELVYMGHVLGKT